MPEEIYQIQPIQDNSVEAIKKLVEELNQKLFSISKRLHDKPTFYPRGDITFADFTQDDLTTDGNWHLLDLSSIITSDNPFLVHITMHTYDNAANETLELRPYGTSGNYNRFQLHTQVANIENDNTALLAIDNRKRVEYRVTNATIDHIEFIVTGWWA
jgi:hypothetical protein